MDEIRGGLAGVEGASRGAAGGEKEGSSAAVAVVAR